MELSKHTEWITPLVIAFAWCNTCYAQVQQAQVKAVNPQALADQIQNDVAELRGKPFKRTVKAELQQVSEFGAYIDKTLEKEVPSSLQQHYGKYIRKLGLYNGPEIEDGTAMMKMVMTSQAGAYYDPETQTFFVLMPNMSELMLGTLYAHELYHGWQDQYFDLNRYVLQPAAQHKLNGDELLARQAVVEGEATYMMTLWMMKRMTGIAPSRDLLGMAVQQQTNMDIEQIRSALKQPQVAQLVGEDAQTAMAAVDKIPPFMFDALIGAYMKGLGFIYSVSEGGWQDVEKLYTDQPPASTEQILHPKKWLANEVPTSIQWPAFTDRALRNWELIEEDVLGEFRWRSVFKAQGLASQAATLAAGWDGDRYAVFKRKDSDEMLLLFYTAWDTNADAAKFIDGYRLALATKYAGVKMPTRLAQKGKDVLIVEGGDEASLNSLMEFIGKSKRTKAH